MSIFNNILDRFNGNRDRKILNDIMESVSALPIMRESYPNSSAAQLAIDDAGWISFNGSGSAYGETDQPTRRRIIERARAYWRQDPLAHQAVRIWTDYAIGDGITMGCENEQAEKTLRGFWESSGNRLQFSAEGQRVASTRLLVDGDIFYALVGEPPEVLVRSIDPLEITSIIADPDDADRILFYKREWIPTDISGMPQSVKTLYYRDWTLDPSEAEELAQSLNATLEDGVAIYHVAFDRYGRWGNSLLTSSLNWNREHRKFMESRVSIIQSLARFAFKAKVAGGQSALTAIKNSLSPVTGSQQPMGATWLENSGIELNAMPRDTGSASAKGDGDMLKLQICAATGIMQHYMGDPSTGNLASTTAMELPMLKMFTSYQRLWSDVYSDIFCYVAGVNRPGDIGLDIDWPPIVDIDDNLRANAISALVASFPALAKLDAVKAQVLETLRINNAESVLEQMKAAEEEDKKAGGQEVEEPHTAIIRPLKKGAGKINPEDDGDGKNPEESGATFIEALRRFRESI